MPLMISSTTSASGTSRRHWRTMVRGNTVDRPPIRWTWMPPMSSRLAAPGYRLDITVTRCPQAIQRVT